MTNTEGTKIPVELTGGDAPAFPALRAVDDCDLECLASAQVRVAKDGRDLVFCMHHYQEHEPALATGGWAIVEDNREKLRGGPGFSA